MGVVSSLVAGTLGTTVLLGGAAYGGYSMYAGAVETEKKKKQVRAKEAADQAARDADIVAAPVRAAEKAKRESLEIRRRRTQTILTSPRGILEPATTERKTLLGGK